MDSKCVVNDALVLAKNRLREIPSFSIYMSCIAQLEYLLSVLNGEVTVDRPKLRTIMLGHYGLREFEETDPDFATALKNAQLIASRMADGLKI
jgi:hypothetical protein